MDNQAMYQKLQGIDLGSKDDNYFRSLSPDFGRGRQDAIDFMAKMRDQDPAVIAQRQQQAEGDLVNKQAGDVTDFLSRQATAVPKIISDTSAKYQIPDQLQGVNALNSRIQTLRGNTDNSGVGGYANGQQVDAAINSRYLPQYTTSMTNLTNSSAQAQNEEAQLEQPYQTEGQMLNDRLNREMTGFTTANQQVLDGLLAKLQAGTTLTTTEMNNANALAAAKLSYDATVAGLQYQPLSPGQKLFQVTPNSTAAMIAQNSNPKV